MTSSLRSPRLAALAAASGIALAAAGTLLPSPTAYGLGVLLACAGLFLALRTRTPLWTAALPPGLVAAMAIAVPALALPRSEGVSGDWAAADNGGALVAGQVLVGGDNSAIDLVTGKTVRLGSVSGGERWVGDGRMLILGVGRIDSVSLDASARWTWRPKDPSQLALLAADRGHTIVRVCPTSTPAACVFVGLGPKGQQVWETGAPGQGAPTEAITGPNGSLPRVGVALAQDAGAGLFLLDAQTGRRTLRPGVAALTLPDGSVAVTHTSGGRCVTSLYAGPDPLWTRVTDDDCTEPKPLAWFASDGLLWVQRQDGWEQLSLRDGRPASIAPATSPEAARAGLVAGNRVAVSSRVPLGLNPFRDGDTASVITVRDVGSGAMTARLVTTDRLSLLRLDRDSVVVREGDRVVRYSLETR